MSVSNTGGRGAREHKELIDEILEDAIEQVENSVSLDKLVLNREKKYAVILGCGHNVYPIGCGDGGSLYQTVDAKRRKTTEIYRLPER